MLDLILITIKRIIDLYKEFPRRLFETTLYFGLTAIIIGLVMSAIVAYCLIELHLLQPILLDASFQEQLFYGMFWNGIEMVTAFSFLFIGLFIVSMHREGDQNIKQRTFKELLEKLTTNNWSSFLMAFIILFVIQLFLTVPLFDHDGSGWGYWQFHTDQTELGTSKTARYMNWMNDVAGLFREYLPYFLVIYLLLADRGINLARSMFSQFKEPLLAVLVLIFLYEALFHQVYHFIATYLLPPITIPFDGSMIAVVFTYMIVLIIVAWSLPLTALLFIGPVQEGLTEKDERDLIDAE